MVDGVSNRTAEEAGPTVESVRLRLALIGPLRLILSVVFVIAARAAGAPSRPALVAYLVGAVVILVVSFNDPRARFLNSPDPGQLPASARVAPAWKHAAHAAFPSTIGVSALAVIALFGRPTLAALLAGVLAGLGAAALLSLYRVDPALYVDTRSRAVFRK
jgi:hypothetical protein